MQYAIDRMNIKKNKWNTNIYIKNNYGWNLIIQGTYIRREREGVREKLEKLIVQQTRKEKRQKVC